MLWLCRRLQRTEARLGGAREEGPPSPGSQELLQCCPEPGGAGTLRGRRSPNKSLSCPVPALPAPPGSQRLPSRPEGSHPDPLRGVRPALPRGLRDSPVPGALSLPRPVRSWSRSWPDSLAPWRAGTDRSSPSAQGLRRRPAVPLGSGRAGMPSRAQPGYAEPSLAGPNRAQPGYAKPSRAEPSCAGPGPTALASAPTSRGAAAAAAAASAGFPAAPALRARRRRCPCRRPRPRRRPARPRHGPARPLPPGGSWQLPGAGRGLGKGWMEPERGSLGRAERSESRQRLRAGTQAMGCNKELGWEKSSAACGVPGAGWGPQEQAKAPCQEGVPGSEASPGSGRGPTINGIRPDPR